MMRFHEVARDLKEVSEAPPAPLISHQDRIKSLICSDEMPLPLSDVLLLVYIVLEPLRSTTVSLAATQSAALARSPSHCSLASRLTLSFIS